MLRYSKLSDAQVLERLLAVCGKEDVSYTDDGLEAIIFTSQGDMRQVGDDLPLSCFMCSLLHDKRCSSLGALVTTELHPRSLSACSAMLFPFFTTTRDSTICSQHSKALDMSTLKMFSRYARCMLWKSLLVQPMVACSPFH